MGEYLLRLIVLLPVLGGLIWSSLWMWKKLQSGVPGQAGSQGRVRIAEILPLGVGTRLAVIEFAGRDLLVAISKSDIRLIADSND